MDRIPEKGDESRAPRRAEIFFLPGVLLTLLALAIPFADGCRRLPHERYSPSYAPRPASREKVLVFGVHPLHNPQQLFEIYDPIARFLTSRVSGVLVRLEASRSYEDFERKLYARSFHLALPNPYQTLRSLACGYRIFGKMGDDDRFRGILIVRRDSGIEKVSDLDGKVISFPAPSALAATMMPLRFLRSKGLDVDRRVVKMFSGSQESSIMNVYLRRSAAAATWPPPWELFSRRNPQIARELVVRWETPSLVNNGLVARTDLDPALVERIGSLLFSLQTHEEGRKLLAAIPLSRFEPATEETYRPVRDFLAAYRGELP